MRLEWELRLKMVYRLNVTFDLEVHLDGFRDTGLVKEYDYYNYSFHYHLLYAPIFEGSAYLNLKCDRSV